MIIDRLAMRMFFFCSVLGANTTGIIQRKNQSTTYLVPDASLFSMNETVVSMLALYFPRMFVLFQRYGCTRHRLKYSAGNMYLVTHEKIVSTLVLIAAMFRPEGTPSVDCHVFGYSNPAVTNNNDSCNLTAEIHVHSDFVEDESVTRLKPSRLTNFRRHLLIFIIRLTLPV